MGREVIRRGGAPTVGFGQAEALVVPAAGASPWAMAIGTSMLAAATGWVIEELARGARGKKKRT